MSDIMSDDVPSDKEYVSGSPWIESEESVSGCLWKVSVSGFPWKVSVSGSFPFLVVGFLLGVTLSGFPSKVSVSGCPWKVSVSGCLLVTWADRCEDDSLKCACFIVLIPNLFANSYNYLSSMWFFPRHRATCLGYFMNLFNVLRLLCRRFLKMSMF